MSEDSWVFDSLVNFLHGNIWKIPVMGFIEEKSVVFDPDSYSNMTDEKEDEFRKIHEEYKALVDFMLSSFMEDLQVSPEQVEEACRLRENQSTLSESHITKVALEQLQAAEDFIIFRRIMTRKNIDLQLQSLELLVAKYGVLSPALRSQDSAESSGDNNGEEDFLQVVIRYSDENDVFESTKPNVNLSSTLHKTLHKPSSQQKDSHLTLSKVQHAEAIVGESAEKGHSSVKKSALEEEHENLSTGISSRVVVETAQSLANYMSLSSAPKEKSQVQFNKVAAEISSSQLMQQETTDLESLEGQKETEAERPQIDAKHSATEVANKGAKKSVKFNETTVAEIATVAPEQHRMLTSVRKALEVNADDETTPSMDLASGGTEEEIQRRRDYLRAQRDKLVALKKQEREKQLAIHNGSESSDGQPQRPKSARAAQMALRSSPIQSNHNEKSLAARRALAERLKHELMEK